MLRLGIIGLATKTNGHPFSYSSIINGYNPKYFPKDDWGGIYNYLQQRHFSEMNIPNVKITHVWTQDKHISSSLAKACFIENIVDESLQVFLSSYIGFLRLKLNECTSQIM